ncbi:MAG: nucleoid-associated protein [Bacteroidales bacterium]
MFYFADAVIDKLIVHQVGSRHENENLFITKKELDADEELYNILKVYFLSNFKDPVFYQFNLEEGENILYNLSSGIFESKEDFVELSQKIAQHLFEQSLYPRIKTGELYIAIINKCIIEDEMTTALGIFKSETKENFLKVKQQSDSFDIRSEIGVNINKLDKGCLIFNTEKEKGYKVCMVDLSGKSKDASYWKEEFLRISQRNDDFYQTQNYMQMFKGFVSEVFNERNGVERADQIDMLNRTAGYFEEKEEFDSHEFENKIIENQDVISAFHEFKDRYTEDRDLEMKDKFGISATAYKKGKSQFKSVLKLDKNFHIYIHGDRSRIVKGFDPKTGLHFYQVFYELEN